MPSEHLKDEFDFLTALMDRIIAGRIDAKTFRDMTDEQRSEYKAKLKAEEKDEIARGLAKHEPEEPQQ